MSAPLISSPWSIARQRIASAALVVFCLLVILPSAHAQLDVEINAGQRDYVDYEDIPVHLKVTNRSGRDIVLSGPDGSDWLEFKIFRGERPVRRRHQGNIFQPMVLKSGQTITQTVDIADYYAMTNFGFYTYQAAVWFSPARKYITSNRSSASVVGARMVWNETFGTTRDRPDDEDDLSDFETLQDEGGNRVMTLRTHKMLKFRGKKKSYLYYRLDDPNTQVVHTCYRLAQIIDIRKPMFAIDTKNHAHALFMVRPQLWAKVEIDVRGNMVEDSQKYYKERETSIPQLRGLPDGTVAVVGGELFDPDADRETRMAMRRVSDRPDALLEMMRMRNQLDSAEE